MRQLTPIMITGSILLSVASAFATVSVTREPDEGGVRLGQRVRVDDGTCPVGQVKEVTGARMNAQGQVVRSRVCVKR